MPREAIYYVIPDLSVFARSLGRELGARDHTRKLSHVELLNLIARAAGHRNLQELQASRRAPAVRPAVEDQPPPLPLSANARRTLSQFDSRDRLVRWPAKYTIQRLAIWVLWTRFESHRAYSEKEVNAVLKAANTFDDHVTLRRELVDHRLLERKGDGSVYRKLPARPDDETRALLAAWRVRSRSMKRSGEDGSD